MSNKNYEKYLSDPNFVAKRGAVFPLRLRMC